MPAKNSRSTTSSTKSQSIDATQLLEEDHDKVRELLAQLEKTTPRAASKREQLFRKIAEEVEIHSTIEEEIFYPAYHEAARTQEEAKLFFEAAEEHALVKEMLAKLEEGDPKSEIYAAQCKVLKDLIEHHAEEEEDEMFPKARKLLGKERLAQLGEELQARKDELQGGATSNRRVNADEGRSSNVPERSDRTERADRAGATSRAARGSGGRSMNARSARSR